MLNPVLSSDEEAPAREVSLLSGTRGCPLPDDSFRPWSALKPCRVNVHSSDKS